MPQVAELIRKEFGIEPKIGDPHLAVAKGAALYSQLPINLIKSSDGANGSVKSPIEEVLGHSYGLIGYQNGKRVCFQMLIRGQNVPASYEYRFPTEKPNQETADLEVTESDKGIWINDADEIALREQRIVDPDYAKILKKVEFHLPSGLNAGTGILVKFNIYEDKIIHINASLENSGETIDFTVEDNSDGSSTTDDHQMNA